MRWGSKGFFVCNRRERINENSTARYARYFAIQRKLMPTSIIARSYKSVFVVALSIYVMSIEH